MFALQARRPITWHGFLFGLFALLSNLVLFCAETGLAQAQPLQPYLVKDINTRTLKSDPRDLTAVNGQIYFSADDGVHGRALWQIAAGQSNARLFQLAPSGFQGESTWQVLGVADEIFFVLHQAGNAVIMKSNGQPNGGRELWRGPFSSLAVLSDMILISKWDDKLGLELFKLDKTSGTTTLVKDIAPGSESSFITCPLVFQGVLYCGADDGVHGYELWRTDGTTQGTFLVQDINPGSEGSTVLGYGQSAVTDEAFFFTARNAATGAELWKSDGTSAGTMLVKDIVLGLDSAEPLFFTAIDSLLYFQANFAIWQSDGTSAGTVKLADGLFGSVVKLNNELYFAGSEEATGIELWQSNGTAGNAKLVKDIWPGINPSAPTELVVFQNNLYFFADDGIHGNELWKSDGTPEGTVLLRDLLPGSEGSVSYIGLIGHELKVLNGALYFRAIHPDAGAELWRSDGSTQGTVLVQDIHSVHTQTSHLYLLQTVGNRLYFFATDKDGNSGLWRSDGTEQGTTPVFVAAQNPGASWVRNNQLISDTLYFTAAKDQQLALWKIGANDATPVRLLELPAGYDECCQIVSTENGFYFFPSRTIRNDVGEPVSRLYELWKFDNSTGEAHKITEVFGYTWQYREAVVEMQGKLYFMSAGSDGGQTGLWASDGTTTGTVAIQSVPLIASQANTISLRQINGALYFVTYGEFLGPAAIWKSDGTPQGTAPLITLTAHPHIVETFALGKDLYYNDTDNTYGKELWRFDTATGQAGLLKDINPGQKSADPKSFIEFAGTLFFVATDEEHGTQLWRSDGTTAGTRRVSEFPQGKAGIFPTNLFVWNDKLVFILGDSATPLSGASLWQTDGSTAGTLRLAQVIPPYLNYTWGLEMAAVNNLLFLSMWSAPTGLELWAVNRDLAPRAYFPVTNR